jgi:hypothetical protein
MANGSAFRFAGVAQQPERSPARTEVAGKSPAPRSIVLPFPRPHRWRAEPFIIVAAGLSAGIAIMLIGLTLYAGGIVFRGLP